VESLKKKKQRAEKIFEILDPLYTTEKTALKYSTPFELLVSTILSAQCTDERVNQVTKVLFKKYKGPEDFVKAPISELEEDIRPTGFFRNKAKSIKACSQALVEKYSGEVPSTDNTDPDKIEKDLEKLLPKDKWRRFSDLLIYHGRAVCKSRKPDHAHCPIFHLCPSKEI